MPPSIQQVQVRNYKSIGRAVVDLEPFTVLVGKNGAGKSNFLDCLAFVQEAVSQSLDYALSRRGGIGAVRRRPHRADAPHLAIRVLADLGDHGAADYEIEVAALRDGGFRVATERCMVQPPGGRPSSFEVIDGEFRKRIEGIRPKLSADRLSLLAASATEEFRPLFDFLANMRFYSIDPARLRELQDRDSGRVLRRDGSNAASVLRALQQTEPASYEHVCALLAAIVDGVERVEPVSLGPKETLAFKLDVGDEQPFSFGPESMSIGTLHLLGVLLAAYQPEPPSLLAIEEPEGTVHPGVAEIVTQVLMGTAREQQVLIATQSADMLDSAEIKDDQLRVVMMRHGDTLIAPASPATRQAIREHLFSAGELLRSDELTADVEAAEAAAERLSISSAVPAA